MIKFEDMLNDVLPEVPGCSNEIAINALRNAAIELYTKSWIVTQYCDPQNTVIGQAVYDLDTFNGQKIIGILSAKYKDQPLVPTSIRMLERSSTRWEDGQGTPSSYLSDDLATIRLYRIPDAVGELNIRVALTPAKNAIGVDNFVYDLYSEQLAAGAKARIMLMPQKPYSDPVTSREYRAQFAAAITDAKWRANASLTSSQLQSAA